MIINIVYVDSNVPAAFTSAVNSAALILERSITNPITVTLQVGYGHFPGETDPPTARPKPIPMPPSPPLRPSRTL